MKKFAIIRTQCLLGDSESEIYGEIIEANNFGEALFIVKKENSTDIFENTLNDNIICENIENEIFTFKNDRSRYQGDIFELKELYE